MRTGIALVMMTCLSKGSGSFLRAIFGEKHLLEDVSDIYKDDCIDKKFVTWCHMTQVNDDGNQVTR